MVTHSDQIDQIAAALAEAQKEIGHATKSATNPHFRSTYADLAAVREAAAPLSKHGIAIVQVPCSDGARIGVETMLLHKSGQWIKGRLDVTAKDEGPQAAGSCITYLRRYALQSFAGIASDDDDGNAAEGKGKPPVQQREQPKALAPAGFAEWLLDLTAVADEGTAKLQDAWKASKAEYRNYLTNTNKAGWEALKQKAEKAQVAA